MASTVKTAGCSVVSEVIPRLSRYSINSFRPLGIFWIASWSFGNSLVNRQGEIGYRYVKGTWNIPSCTIPFRVFLALNWCQGWVGHVLQSHVSFQKVDTALKIGTVPTVPGCNTDSVLLFTVNKRKSKKEKMFQVSRKWQSPQHTKCQCTWLTQYTAVPFVCWRPWPIWRCFAFHVFFAGKFWKSWWNEARMKWIGCLG